VSGDADDIDAEFEDIVSHFASSTPEHGGNPEESGEGAAGDTSEEDLDTPVDESLHLEGGHLSVALVLAPLPSPGALHSLLALAGLKEAVVRLRPWTAVWLSVETTPSPEDELASLLGGAREMPTPVDTVARVVSRLSKFGAVAIMSWLVEGEGIEPGVSGQITARRYVHGEPEEDIPAGVLLGSMPPATEDLLLGRTKPTDYEDSVAPDGTVQRRPGPFGWFRRK